MALLEAVPAPYSLLAIFCLLFLLRAAACEYRQG